MVYLGRSEALAPIYLLRRDFTVSSDPAVLAHDPALDVGAFSWARDGSHGAALLSDVLVSIEPGVDKRRLAETIRTLTFGQDASTVYAVRVTESGANDTATVLAIDFASGAATDLTSVTYARPQVQAQEVLREAQFADDGGAVRLFWLEDGTLMMWVLGASGWQIDPATGATTEVGAESLPNLWSPQADQRVMVAESGSTSSLVLYNANGEEVARTVAEGLVSHMRWAPDGSQVVFTLGRANAGGGVLQDLFMWNLEPDTAPTQTTNTGAAFGAEWLGSVPLWRR
jgi:Tol biopolymer transport system component